MRIINRLDVRKALIKGIQLEVEKIWGSSKRGKKTVQIWN